ncbi:MAG: DUF86 domain-containing protein [Planctomycetes bacterium]|nr:DUF86 domain-containing protein [Planctomycetota bacterium]
MLPDEFDAARLWDMLAYAREIAQTLGGRSFQEYLGDKNLRLATERRIEIIGEAANNVSSAFQDSNPSIPWKKIVALRHILAHEYGEVKQDVVFRIATVHIPGLISSLEKLVPELPEE